MTCHLRSHDLAAAVHPDMTGHDRVCSDSGAEVHTWLAFDMFSYRGLRAKARGSGR